MNPIFFILNVPLKQEATRQTASGYQYEFNVSPKSLSFSYLGEEKSVTVTSRRRLITYYVDNNEIISEGQYSSYTYSSSISGSGFTKVDSDTIRTSKRSEEGSIYGEMIFNQTQTDKCTLSNYQSDSSSVTVLLSQNGIPIPNIIVNIPFTNISWDSIDNVGGALLISSISAVDNEGLVTQLVSNIRLDFGTSGNWETYTYQTGASSSDDRIVINKLRFRILSSSLNGGSNTIRSLYVGYYGTQIPTSPYNSPTAVLFRLTSSNGVFEEGTYDSVPINVSFGPGTNTISIGIYYRNSEVQ